MTLCVFLAAGNIIQQTRGDTFQDLRGLFREMPFSMTAFVVAALSMIGVPPTCGFFSKWYLISGAIAAGQYAFVTALLFSSLVNVVLFFRIIEIGFFEPFADHHHDAPESPRKEAPVGMVIETSISPEEEKIPFPIIQRCVSMGVAVYFSFARAAYAINLVMSHYERQVEKLRP